MKTRIEKLRAALKEEKERELARARERARKRMAKGAELSRLIRSADTRTKILAGSWALARAEKSEEFRLSMMRELDRYWLVRDDDRELFGLTILNDDEKARREATQAKSRGKASEGADGAAALSEGSATLPHPVAVAREQEAA